MKNIIKFICCAAFTSAINPKAADAQTAEIGGVDISVTEIVETDISKKCRFDIPDSQAFIFTSLIKLNEDEEMVTVGINETGLSDDITLIINGNISTTIGEPKIIGADALEIAAGATAACRSLKPPSP